MAMTQFFRLSRELATLAIGQVVSIIASVVSIKIITSEVGPDIYGNFNILLTLQVGLMQLLFGPIGGACLRFTTDAINEKKSHDLLVAAIRLALKYSVYVISIGVIIFGLIPGDYLGYSSVPVLVMAINTVFFGILHILIQYLNGARKRNMYAFVSASLPLLQFGFCWLTLQVIGKSLYSITVGYALASAIATLVASFYILRLCIVPENCQQSVDWVSSGNNKAWINRISTYSLHFSQWGVFTLMYVISDKWALNLTGGPQEVGTYSLGYQLGYTPVAIAGGLLMQFVSPIIFKSVDRRGGQLYISNRGIKLVMASIACCMIFSIVYAAIAKFAIGLIAPRNYLSAYQYGPLLAIAAGLVGCSEMIGLLFQSEERIRSLVSFKIVISMFGMALNYFLASSLGSLGVSWSMLIYGCVQLSLIIYLWTRKRST